MMYMFKNQTIKNQESGNKLHNDFLIGFSILSILLLWSWV